MAAVIDGRSPPPHPSPIEGPIEEGANGSYPSPIEGPIEGEGAKSSRHQVSG
jgi:hypothetical protein